MVNEAKTKWLLRQNLNLITGNIREGSSAISKLLSEFKEIAVFGGAIRDVALGMNVNQASDIDIVVDAEEIELKKIFRHDFLHDYTKFGGLRFKYHNRHYDIWSLKKTWAFKEGHVKCGTMEDLVRTTFFTIDAAYYTLPSHDLTCHARYFSDLEKKVLDINLEPNPNPSRMAKRALAMAINHQFSLTPHLVDYVLRHYVVCNLFRFESELLKAMSMHLKASGTNFLFNKGFVARAAY